MSDSFTEVTNQSWSSRLGGSIKGILFGIVLFIAAFPLLFWNEGRAIKTEKSLEEGAAAVVSISPEAIDPANEGKLVHTSGMTATDESLQDSQFNIAVNAISLSRKVSIYQWQESSESHTEKESGGGTKTTKTYSYSKQWSSTLSSSSSFKHPEGHQNPASKPYENQTWYANNVTIGQFKLNSSQIRQIRGAQAIPITKSNLPASGNATISGQDIYLGDPSKLQIGDARISFQAIKPGQISLIAQQQQNTFMPYTTSFGETIQLLTSGHVSAIQMFETELSKNTILTWIIRLVGFLVMTLGLSLIFKPLSVLGDVVPFIGNVLEGGIGIAAGLISFALSLSIIAVAWIFYRPLIAAVLIAIVFAVLYLLKKKVSDNKEAASTISPAKPSPPPTVY